MLTFNGDSLRNLVNKRNAANKRKRYIFSELDEYIKNENTAKVFCLYGLRRTGKTIMMAQAVADLNEYDNILYVLCEKNDTMMMLRRTLEAYDADYIFIDEITKIRDFINTCSYLADVYSFSGKKVVMAGTDSFGFKLARRDELYDRSILLHTTYISYNEYNYLLGRGIEEYIQYGGTLSEDNERYNFDDLNEYSNEAIVDNLMHSLENWDHGQRFGILQNAYDSGALPSAIKKVIDRENRDFLSSTIEKDFFAYELHSLNDLLVKNNIVDLHELNIDDIIGKLRILLGVREPINYSFDQATISEIIKYLIELDVLYQIPGTNEYIFIQPGFRYNQVKILADALIYSDGFNDLDMNTKRHVYIKLEENIKGKILEDIVFIELSKNLSNMKKLDISKFSSLNGEFDVVVTDYSSNKSILFEVKHSEKIVKRQAAHLRSNEACDEFWRKYHTLIAAKVVIYMGQNAIDDDVIYLNAENFLKNSLRFTELLFGGECENKSASASNYFSDNTRVSVRKQIEDIKKESSDKKYKGLDMDVEL